jgi:hypothetical protein
MAFRDGLLTVGTGIDQMAAFDSGVDREVAMDGADL